MKDPEPKQPILQGPIQQAIGKQLRGILGTLLQAREKKAERNLAHAKNELKSAQIWLQNFSNDSQELARRLKEILASKIEERRKLVPEHIENITIGGAHTNDLKRWKV